MLLALLLACTLEAPEDTGADTADTAAPDEGYTLYVTTVATDFSAGQLATVASDGTVTDAILPTSTDPVVETDGDHVFLIDRSSENTVRMYAAGDFSAPLVEFSTGDSSNPQDAALCGDAIVVTTLATDTIGLYDAQTGLARGTFDLGAYDDGDGSPEADAIVRGPDGDLFVTLGQLDTTSYPWVSADGTGTILRIQCDFVAIADAYEVGPNPSLAVHPADPTKMLLRTGDYYNDDYSPKLDGALYTFDPATGAVSEPHLTEEAFGMNLGAIAGNKGGKAVLVADDAYSWGVWCVDLTTWATTATPGADSYIGDAVTSPDGTAWIAYRPGYAHDGSPVLSGLVAWDPETCTAAAPTETLFPPYGLALSE